MCVQEKNFALGQQASASKEEIHQKWRLSNTTIALQNK
jgi:hypothetical protein